MSEIIKLKKNYRIERERLFQRLIKNNDGFSFNQHHTKLVDKIVKEIVKSITKTHPVTDFTLIAVGGYGRHDLSPKSDVDLLFLYKKNNKNIRGFITELNNCKEQTLNDLLKQLNETDIVIVEGFKNDNHPKIEIIKKGSTHHLFNKISNIKAIISEEEINTDLKQFKKDEIDNIVNFILEKM